MKWIRNLFSSSKESQNDSVNDELRDWQIVTAKNESGGQGAIFRIRMHKPNVVGLETYATAVEISWPTKEQMPSHDENQRQLTFERAVDALSCENGFAELVQVSTGLGVKEWLYYTADQSRFMKEFNECLTGHAEYPIKIAFYNDPSWDLWRKTVDSINAR